MKKISVYFLLLLLFLSASSCKNIDNSGKYEIATWKGFADAAINFTFDDGCPYQFTRAVPMFDRYGFQATFYLIPDWVQAESKPFIQSALNAGHEVGSHSISHSDMSQLDDTLLRDELKNSQIKLEKMFSFDRCLTMAYPYCIPANAEITREYYIAARDCRGDIEKKTPDSYYHISSIGCGNLSEMNSLPAFRQKFAETASVNGWCALLFHGLDDDGSHSPITSELLEEILLYLHGNNERFWVSSLLNTTLYSKERDAAVLTEKKVESNRISLNLTDDLDDRIYNYPLTIRRSLPPGWKRVQVTQNDNTVSSDILEIEGEKYIVFDAIPDGGEIVLVKQ